MSSSDGNRSATQIGQLLRRFFLNEEFADLNGRCYTPINVNATSTNCLTVGRNKIAKPFAYAKACYGSDIKNASAACFNKLVRCIVALDQSSYDVVKAMILDRLSQNLYWYCMDRHQQGAAGGWSREMSVVDDLRATIAIFRDRKIAKDQGCRRPSEDLADESGTGLKGIDEIEVMLAAAPPADDRAMISAWCPWINVLSTHNFVV